MAAFIFQWAAIGFQPNAFGLRPAILSTNGAYICEQRPKMFILRSKRRLEPCAQFQPPKLFSPQVYAIILTNRRVYTEGGAHANSTDPPRPGPARAKLQARARE
jgi:hypothetical protein